MDIEYGLFVWDAHKETVNIEKHGIDFVTASRVFIDRNRKIYVDKKHCGQEERLFCMGKIGNRVLTVRFTYRGNRIRIIGAGWWRKGRKYYESRE